MSVIKFSHRYKKMLPNVEHLETFVLDVSYLHFRDLTAEEIREDTETVGGDFYELPRTWLIRIKLWTPYWNPETGKSEKKEWCTMRRYTEEKFAYYKSLIGMPVGIEIQSEGGGQS